jgi:hypothetical protein
MQFISATAHIFRDTAGRVSGLAHLRFALALKSYLGLRKTTQ